MAGCGRRAAQGFSEIFPAFRERERGRKAAEEGEHEDVDGIGDARHRPVAVGIAGGQAGRGGTSEERVLEDLHPVGYAARGSAVAVAVSPQEGRRDGVANFWTIRSKS